MRGCLSSLSEQKQEECLSNGDFCKVCSSRMCNKKDNFPKCFVKQWSSKTCKNYNDVCFAHLSGEQVDRGCFREYAQENQLSITFKDENANNPSFKICSTPNCNKDEFGLGVDLGLDTDYGNGNEDGGQIDLSSDSEEDDQKSGEFSDSDDDDENNNEFSCYLCDSRDDKNCKSNLNSELIMCPIDDSEAPGCYHVISGKHIILFFGL